MQGYNNLDSHAHFMRQALQLAEERRGFCAPNPAVGAVVVKENKIIAKGLHWACGEPHAEMVALQSLGAAAGSSLYVTLEPCSHFGRTPPCTDLIVSGGVSEVFFGMKDPNPRVSGGGENVLQKAGIPCSLLALDEVKNFYQSYRYWLKTQSPWVTLKLAISLDGKIAGLDGKPVAITGGECQQLTHQYRLRSDAILSTAATVLADNPQLNVRLNGNVEVKPLYLLDSRLRVPLQAQIFKTTRSVTVFHSPKASTEKLNLLKKHSIRCIAVDQEGSFLNLKQILAVIGADGCHDLWVEAGGRCFQSFVNQGLAHQILIYVSPKVLGSEAINAFQGTWPDFYQPQDWKKYGQDTVIAFKTLVK